VPLSDASGTQVFGDALYDPGEVAGAERAVGASLGCGAPTAVAHLHEGETVLDLGSGAGADVLISATPTQCGAYCSKQRRGVSEREMSRADGKLGIRSRGELGDALASGEPHHSALTHWDERGQARSSTRTSRAR
jgi:hypothetical protein